MILTETTAPPDTGTKSGRKWIYPALRKGRFYQYRTWLSYVYLLLFFTGPFIRIGGRPFLLLNVLERRFVIFGQVFWPQDFFLFVLAMLAGMVCIVLFTIAFGRLFCGWICPQTIFMEMVFRKIEIWIEGDERKRRKLDEGPLTNEKLLKKTAKHAAFLLLSFLIANTFLAYLIGSEELLNIITQPVANHLAGFISIWIFTLVFYFVYTRVRELVCTVICPYGRLQGVFTDKHTLLIAYNYLRGEPRGKISRKDPTPKGDCVDCSLCVDVCPTGIDIRKGNQLECVNCTACIDACDYVMDKTGRPRNLIGFYSQDVLEENKKPAFTGRMIAYSAIIVVLLGMLTAFVVARSGIDVTILRQAGMLYQERPEGYISNIYNADLINKTDKQQVVTLVPADPQVKIKYIQAPGLLDKEGSAKAIFFVLVPAKNILNAKITIILKVMVKDKLITTISTTFTGPINGD